MTDSNFSFLAEHNPIFWQLARTAEQVFVSDPNTTLVKLRQLAEALAKDLALRLGIRGENQSSQADLILLIDRSFGLDTRIRHLFHRLRIAGNTATHEFETSHREAMEGLKVARELAIWFHRSFGAAGSHFKAGAFIAPKDPSERLYQLNQQVQQLNAELQASQQNMQTKQALLALLEQQKSEAEALAQLMNADAQQYKQQVDALELALLQQAEHYAQQFKQLTVELANQQGQAAQNKRRNALLKKIQLANKQIDLTEDMTRALIDEQLRQVGWQVDSQTMRFELGTRPEPKTFKAIAEWEVAGKKRADYVLFDGLTPIAVIEAKRKYKNVYSAIDQAKVYAQQFKTHEACTLLNDWQGFKIPFAFASNGRAYLPQLAQESGIWFLDLRDTYQPRRALEHWYSPQDLRDYLKHNTQQAANQLQAMPFQFDFNLRPYQIQAIQAVEQCISQAQRNILLAMATGTGKTKTCIALIYRLLKAERFRRILFLVDRSALGQQAFNAFYETRMEHGNTLDLLRK